MHRAHHKIVLGVFLMTALTGSGTESAAGGAVGPLRVCEDNPRYFTDGSGKAVYLVGSHTWDSLQDMSPSDPPQAFDWDAYLDFLQRYHHNFIRLWRGALPRNEVLDRLGGG